MNLPECLPSLFKIDKKTFGNKWTSNGIWLVLKYHLQTFFENILAEIHAEFLFSLKFEEMVTKLLLLSKRKLYKNSLAFQNSFPIIVCLIITILFLLRIGQNCKRSTVIQICGRPQKNREYGNCRGTYCSAVFQAVWHIADTHDERYDMQATNLKPSVKKQEWDMARVEKARIQSHCTFVYSLIKSFTYFFFQ